MMPQQLRYERDGIIGREALHFVIYRPSSTVMQTIMGSQGARSQLPFQSRTRCRNEADNRGFGPWSAPTIAIIQGCSMETLSDDAMSLTMDLRLMSNGVFPPQEALTRGRPALGAANLSLQSRGQPMTLKNGHRVSVRTTCETFETYDNGTMFATFTPPFESVLDYLQDPSREYRTRLTMGAVDLDFVVTDLGFDSEHLHVDLVNLSHRQQREINSVVRPSVVRHNTSEEMIRAMLSYTDSSGEDPVIVPERVAQHRPLLRMPQPEIGTAAQRSRIMGIDLGSPDGDTMSASIYDRDGNLVDVIRPGGKKPKKAKKVEPPKGPRRTFRLDDD